MARYRTTLVHRIAIVQNRPATTVEPSGRCPGRSSDRKGGLFTVARCLVRAARHRETAIVFTGRVAGVELAIGRGCVEGERAEHPPEVFAAREIDHAILLRGRHDHRVPEREDFEKTTFKENLIAPLVQPYESCLERTTVGSDGALPSARPAPGKILGGAYDRERQNRTNRQRNDASAMASRKKSGLEHVDLVTPRRRSENLRHCMLIGNQKEPDRTASRRLRSQRPQ